MDATKPNALNAMNDSASETVPLDFIREIVAQDVAAQTHARIVTRFPPEPNGYLHIGHAKSICLNFGIARDFGGVCNLRMDDTNPTKEDTEYVESIQADVRWLIAGWADHVMAPQVFYASDYFPQLYEYAVALVKRGKAFVCDQTADEFMAARGTPTVPGKESPCRNRSVKDNLDLLARMKKGEFPDGAKTLRAKIDMASPNMHMRDPALYRIRHAHHHRTGDAWCLYPTYDFAHCLSDSIEGITHSICTLEFEVHRPLYDWILENVPVPTPRPHQYEFARLALDFTVMSKRKLLKLVVDGDVSGWDDPRMPTISGIRRRGVPAPALRAFCQRVGVTKFNSLTEVAVLEHAIRTDLNKRCPRRLAVLRPLKVILTNYPADRFEELSAINNPEDPDAGTRLIPFGRELFIDQDDFREDPPKKYFRLRPDGEVRLKYGYIIQCQKVLKDEKGDIVEIHATADLESKSGGATSGRKIKGTIHWVSAPHAVDAEVRLYDRLFNVPDPGAGGETGDFKQYLNPNSLEVVHAKCEPSLAEVEPGFSCQFERLGYFCRDTKESGLVFNRTITLRDAWAKEAQKS